MIFPVVREIGLYAGPLYAAAIDVRKAASDSSEAAVVTRFKKQKASSLDSSGILGAHLLLGSLTHRLEEQQEWGEVTQPQCCTWTSPQKGGAHLAGIAAFFYIINQGLEVLEAIQKSGPQGPRSPLPTMCGPLQALAEIIGEPLSSTPGPGHVKCSQGTIVLLNGALNIDEQHLSCRCGEGGCTQPGSILKVVTALHSRIVGQSDVERALKQISACALDGPEWLKFELFTKAYGFIIAMPDLEIDKCLTQDLLPQYAKQLVHVVQQLGVIAAKTEGVVHADLRFPNLVLRKNGNLVLVDLDSFVAIEGALVSMTFDPPSAQHPADKLFAGVAVETRCAYYTAWQLTMLSYPPTAAVTTEAIEAYLQQQEQQGHGGGSGGRLLYKHARQHHHWSWQELASAVDELCAS
eukprot:981229-Amphidinium_carterae.1